MVHRAICGSLERLIALLIEHHAGHFPLWLAPKHIGVAPITHDGDYYERAPASAWPPRAGRSRPPQREDHLQGPRALAGETPGAAGGRPQGSRDEVGLDAPPRFGEADRDAAGRRARRARRRSGAAGRETDARGGVALAGHIVSENRYPPRIRSGAGFFGIMPYSAAARAIASVGNGHVLARGGRIRVAMKRSAQRSMSLCSSVAYIALCRSRRSSSGIPSARLIAAATASVS